MTLIYLVPYAKRALRDAKLPASLEQVARLIQSNRSVAGLVFMALVFLMTGAILFQTENVVFPSQRSLMPANPKEIAAAIAGERKRGQATWERKRERGRRVAHHDSPRKYCRNLLECLGFFLGFFSVPYHASDTVSQATPHHLSSFLPHSSSSLHPPLHKKTTTRMYCVKRLHYSLYCTHCRS